MLDIQHVEITTSCGSQQEAEKIATHLVENHWAACVQILGPMTSIFWWENQVEKATEWKVSVKTRRSMIGRVNSAIREMHSYEVPEILALGILEGNSEYMKWFDEELNEMKEEE